jgi:hypothetical protein
MQLDASTLFRILGFRTLAASFFFHLLVAFVFVVEPGFQVGVPFSSIYR